MECIFCNIVAKKASAHIVYENDKVLAFLDIFPSSPGHMMVIHKRHGNSVLDYSEKELGEVMSGVKVMSGKLQNVFACDSITIGINHLEKKGVPHLHVHLIPRWDTDGGSFVQSVVKTKSKDSLEEIVKKLKAS